MVSRALRNRQETVVLETAETTWKPSETTRKPSGNCWRKPWKPPPIGGGWRFPSASSALALRLRFAFGFARRRALFGLAASRADAGKAEPFVVPQARVPFLFPAGARSAPDVSPGQCPGGAYVRRSASRSTARLSAPERRRRTVAVALGRYSCRQHGGPYYAARGDRGRRL